MTGKLEEALRAYARMLNTGDVPAFEPYLADDFVYESQMVLTPLRGKTEFLEYIVPKLQTVAASDRPVFAEMAEVSALGQELPCVLTAQGTRDNLLLLVLGKICGDRLARLDLCVVPPPWSARRSGEYPT